MKKKIMFVTSNLVMGGAERIITFLANQLSEIKEYEVIIYSYEGKNSFYKLKKEIKFITEDKIYKNYYFRRVFQIFQVRKAIKKIKPDIVISFLPNQNMFSILGTMFTKIPVIVSERGDPFRDKGLLPKIKNFFLKYATTIVFQSTYARAFFKKTIQNKSIVIPNPITEHAKERDYKERKNEIVFVGRFDINQKRQDLMVEAFDIVLKHFPEYKLNFYGIGSDLNIIKTLVSKKRIQDKVIFHGQTKNIQDELIKYKIFVLTSDFEGMPNSLIEAMSCGLSVVTTDFSPGTAKDLIENYVNGIIVRNNNPSEIAKAIMFLIKNDDKSEEIAIEAKQINKLLEPKKIINQWVELIDNATKECNKDKIK